MSTMKTWLTFEPSGLLMVGIAPQLRAMYDIMNNKIYKFINKDEDIIASTLPDADNSTIHSANHDALTDLEAEWQMQLCKLCVS